MKTALPLLLSAAALVVLPSCSQTQGTPDPYGAPAPIDGQGYYQEAPIQPIPAPDVAPDFTTGNSAPVASGTTVPHQVQKGDTLWGLSRKYGTTVEAIRSANDLSGDIIVLGTTIQIPQ